MPTVSIIIPIYNAAKEWEGENTTLHRCIDSVLHQDFEDFELILINDGSSDDSGKIIDSYASADPRITAIHKPNSGVSDTRNQGILAARGKYIQFIDADDWIDPEAVKLLVRTIEASEADMVIADFYRVIKNRTAVKGSIDDETLLTRTEYADAMMKNPADFYYGVLWNKLFRREIIEENNIQMDTSLSWCEDFVFNLEYVYYCRQIAVLHVPIYYYVKTEGSLVSQSVNVANAIRMKLNLIEYYDDFYQGILTEEEYRHRRPVIYSFLFSAAGDGTANPINPSTKRLGTERVSVRLRENASDNAYTYLYYMQKLMDRYLETAANEYDLDLRDIKILLYFMSVDGNWDIKEAADYAGIQVPLAAASVESLILKKYLHRSHGQVGLTVAADPITDMIRQTMSDYEHVCFDGIDEKEKTDMLQKAKAMMGSGTIKFL